ncbi:MAG: ATP-binding protein [Myxococcota bacterium]|nr:ATP-binding protein [Myxococcota bacterium]
MSSLRVTPTMLHSIDNQGRIEEVSDQWLTRLGYTWDEVIGRRSTEFLSEESARYAREVVLPRFFETGSCDVEYDMRRKDGVLIPVRLRGVAVRSDNGAFLRSIAVIEDLTEQRALEKKMFDAQKLESLGHMAGNIAHDFNNLLASIVGNAQLAMRHAVQVPAAVSSLEHIMTASARAAELCRQLLAYSGQGRFHIEEVALDALVTEMIEVLEVNVGAHAQIELALATRGTTIMVDATQLRQIVMNLVLNAAEALTPGGGTIKITTSVEQLDAATIAATSRPDITPGSYVALEVSDDGPGMTPEIAAQIFDPFFTTKATGRGLGLAAVHGIVRGHHGTMRVHSELGRGTCFKIFLPAHGRGTTLLARSVTPAPTDLGTVLVVDDDELLRTTLANQLDEAGYHVHVAGTVGEALAIARSTRVITFLIDVTMPDLSGPDLAAQIRVLRPEAYVVLMSGYNRVDMPAPQPRTRFLQKPFTQQQLLRAIERTP